MSEIDVQRDSAGLIDSQSVYAALRQQGVTFFTGVPDSLLRELGTCIADQTRPDEHVIAANEGAAIALAAGHYLATGKPAVVYMQNAGLGNAVNPLLSLADPSVYALPMLLFVGLRGAPNVPDEPQHIKQGTVTVPLLEVMDVPHEVLPQSEQAAVDAIQRGLAVARERGTPYALVVMPGTFAARPREPHRPVDLVMTREDAIAVVLERLPARAVVVSTTGKASREVFEYAASRGRRIEAEFLNVGAMGHASQIALGIALARPDRPVYCLDGDGAFIMHMGAAAIIGGCAPKHFVHVILNNGVHDSVGGQPTVGFRVDLSALATACGYSLALRADTPAALEAALDRCVDAGTLGFIDVRTRLGSRDKLGRPATSPSANRDAFMTFLRRQ